MFPAVQGGQNRKDKFSKSTWSLLTSKIARDLLKLLPFPKSTDKDFNFHVSVMVECILLAYTY